MQAHFSIGIYMQNSTCMVSFVLPVPNGKPFERLNMTSSHLTRQLCACLVCISHCWCSEASCRWPHCPTESWKFSSPPSVQVTRKTGDGRSLWHFHWDFFFSLNEVTDGFQPILARFLLVSVRIQRRFSPTFCTIFCMLLSLNSVKNCKMFIG